MGGGGEEKGKIRIMLVLGIFIVVLCAPFFIWFKKWVHKKIMGKDFKKRIF